ncbi:MAG TPA: glycoside hydrolase family 5 protein [Mycobacteriales bacterium]|nr:glycoside hydrolase family 5 protein [Mycobacteriales bacterium]
MRASVRRVATVSALVAVAGWVALPAQAGHKKPTPPATTTTTATTPSTPGGAPTGQVTTVINQSRFDNSLAGWSPVIAPTSWTPAVGHDAPGAAAVKASGIYTAAASPLFAVKPGARYSAEAWSLAGNGGGHDVGVALKFYSANGQIIPGSTQISQPTANNATAWTNTYRAVGFAPGNAASGSVLTLSMDTVTGVTDFFDDVTVSESTGTAAPVVGPLTTSGTSVLDGQGRRVQLHGMQLGGMKNANWTPDTVTTAEIDAAHRWGANLARLPVAENPFVSTDCSYDPNYVSTIDRIVNDVTGRGMVLLLDLHTNAVTKCGVWEQQQKMPDGEAVNFWQAAAARYKDNPLVAFDLYNEPHDVTDAQWRNGGTLTSSGVTYQAAGMQKLYDTVRATGARNLVFASGRGWASVYPATAPLTGTSNLVWAVHAYTCPTLTPANGGTCQAGPAGVEDPSGILNNFANIGLTQPVMVTEFGWPDPTDGDYIANVASYAAAHGWVGWNAFTFQLFTGSQFDLLKDPGVLWDPQASGVSVINGMLGD